MTHAADKDPTPRTSPGRHRLLPIAGGGLAIAALLAHLGGGAMLMHVGLPALLAYLGLGAGPANLTGGALVAGIVVVVAVNLLLVFGARRWLRHRGSPHVDHEDLGAGRTP